MSQRENKIRRPINMRDNRPTGAQGATGLTGAPKEKDALIYAFQKLEDTVPRCDASVPQWIMVAVRNNEKLFSNINISEDTYLTNHQRISGYVVEFHRNCNCTRISRIPIIPTSVLH